MCAARVEVAAVAGACYGVERALGLALQAAKSASGDVLTLGPIVHNPRVIVDLADQGVHVAKSPEDAAGATLLLRAHGVSPEEERRAHEACAQVIDATCPFVKRVHVAAERLARDGRQVVIAGEAGHPEVEGTRGHVPGALVVGSAEEAARARVSGPVGVVVQTTLARATLDAIVAALRDHTDDVEVVDTICDATSRHQEAAAHLAAQADVMVVVGGRNSANTTHLAQICSEACPTHHVESEDELEPAWFEGAGLVGITAGASTPAAHIDAVRAAIEGMVGA